MEENQQFEITDMQSLSWVFRKIIAPAKKRIEDNKRLADYERNQIDKWLREVNASDEQKLELWTNRIYDFHAAELRNGGTKTLSTPFGKVKSTTSKPQPDLADKDKLLAFIKENQYSGFLKVEESVRWVDLKKTLSVAGNNVVDENGLIVEGAKVKPETTTFKIEVD